MRNVNLPKTAVFIRCDAWGGSASEFEPAWLVSARAMRDRPFAIQAWIPKYAACYDKIPPQCLFWKKPSPGEAHYPLHKLQMWECLSGSVECWTKRQLIDVPMLINMGKGEKPATGHYWFTLDYLPEGQAAGLIDVGDTELLEEHKEANFVKLTNGQVAIYPNNRLKWMPLSLTPKGAASSVPGWEVASNAQWDEWWDDSSEILGDSSWAY